MNRELGIWIVVFIWLTLIAGMMLITGLNRASNRHASNPVEVQPPVPKIVLPVAPKLAPKLGPIDLRPPHGSHLVASAYDLH